MVGVLFVVGLVVMVAWAVTAAPAHAAKLERLKIAIAPTGWDTNFTWLNPRSANLDKRPSLEFLVGIDRHTGAYIPELAEKWEMAPDGKSWTITLRKGVKFHEHWGEFSARDVRHAVFLITQPESMQSDTNTWRTLMGVEKTDTIEDVARKVAEGVEIVNDYQVVFRLKQAAPEFVETISANTDLVIESKPAGMPEARIVRAEGGGHRALRVRRAQGGRARALQAGREPLAPDAGIQRAEFRWVPEGVTRLATLLAEEIHISDVERALQKDAMGDADPLEQTAGHPARVAFRWAVLCQSGQARHEGAGGQARAAGHDLAINRQAIAQALLGGQVQPMRCMGIIPSWTVTSGQGSGTPTGTSASKNSTGTILPKLRHSSKKRGMPGL